MRYLSLFSGIGGFELGIQQAYELQKLGIKSKDSTDATSTTPQHPECPLCVGYSEIDKYAIQTYQSHFPEHKNYGDIKSINADELPDFDLLVGGFPCQAFSIAGKRKGFEDTRGTLFFEIARILRAKQPRLFCLENVKGLLSHDNGETFRTIISTLDELGYNLQWQVLNSKNYGVPQNRERVFIIGNRRGTERPAVFPLVDSGNTLTTLNRFGKLNVYNTDAQAGKIYTTDGISPTVSGQRVNSQGWILNGKQQITINEKVYQMSESVSSYAKTLLFGMEQSKGQALSVSQMQELFKRIKQGIQSKECSEVEREPQDLRQESKRDIQEVETLGSFLESGDDTGGVCGVVSIPTEDMLVLWDRRIDVESSTRRLQQQDKENDDRPNRLYQALQSSEHYPLLFAVQPYQGKLFYSIGDGRDWVNVYQTKVETICKENNLSSILEEQVDQKYFLSEKQVETVLNRTKNYENRLATRSGQIIPMGNLTKPMSENEKPVTQ